MANELEQRPWQEEYVDACGRFLDDQDAHLIYEQHPTVPHSPLDGCPTCDKTGEYLWNHEIHKCNCEEQLQLHKFYLHAGIGDVYQRLDWDDYASDEHALGCAVKYLNNHSSYVRAGLGMAFTGPFGSGKTMLCCLAAKALVRLGYDVFFCTFQDMTEMFTSGWKSEEDKRRFERRVVRSQVLVLDDIGKEFRTKTQLSESLFDHVLRQRVLNARPTFLTTNESQEQLRKGYGSAVISLIGERAIWIECEGKDFRPTARERAVEEAESGWRRPIS